MESIPKRGAIAAILRVAFLGACVGEMQTGSEREAAAYFAFRETGIVSITPVYTTYFLVWYEKKEIFVHTDLISGSTFVGTTVLRTGCP